MIFNKVLSSYKNEVNQATLEKYRGTFHTLMLMTFVTSSIGALFFFPRSVYLNEHGISKDTYGLLLSMANAITFFMQIAVGRISDRIKRRKLFIRTGILLSICAESFFLFTQDAHLLSTVLVVDIIAFSISNSMFAVTISSISNNKSHGRNFGLFKMAGSFSWVLFSTLAGVLIHFFSFKVLTAVVILINIGSFLIVHFIIEEPPFHDESNRNDTTPITKKERFHISPVLLGIAFLYLFCMMNNSGGFTYLLIYLKEQMHASDIIASWVIAVPGLYELAGTLFVGRLCDKYSKVLIIACGCALGASRWILIPLINNIYAMFLIQILHAITICTLSISFTSYISSKVPLEHRGTAFGILVATGMVGSILGQTTVGIVSERGGLPMAYTVIGCIGIASVAVFAAFYFIYAKGKAIKQEKKAVVYVN